MHILPGLPNTLRPENNPPNHRQEESQKHLPQFLEGREDAPFGHLVGVLAVLAREDERQEQNGVVRAPGDEGPVGAVPETRQQEDDEGVAHHLGFRDAAAAQRDVDEIPEPSRQSEVPAAPELGDVAAEIRHVEVAHQLDSEQLRRSDGDVRIAREVAIDLEGEEDGGKKQSASALLGVGRKHLVNIHGAIVGHHNLLEQAPKDLPHTIHGGVVVELAFLQELRQEVRRPLDGAGHELREERDEGEEGDDVLGRLNLAAIDINGIGKCLEGVERDADGKYHLEQQALRGNVEQLRELSDEEVIVLEDGQNQQIQDDIGRSYPFLPFSN